MKPQAVAPENIAAACDVSVKDLEQLPGTVYERLAEWMQCRNTLADICQETTETRKGSRARLGMGDDTEWEPYTEIPDRLIEIGRADVNEATIRAEGFYPFILHGLALDNLGPRV